MINIDEVDKLADKISKPYITLSKILGILLIISIIGNIYLSIKKVEITLVANNNKSSEIIQTNE